MQPTFENQVISSFNLWLDNKILSNGGYTNYSGTFYPIASPYSNYYAYGISMPQIVSDCGIAGANVITGVYLNNTFITTGQSGFVGIDYNRGYAYFSQNANSYVISGHFAVKEFNVKLTNDNEESLLMSTRYQIKPKYPQTPTGVPDATVLFPIVYVKNAGGVNKPFALGGQDTTNLDVRCIILADSLYSLHAVQSVLKDSARTPVALFDVSEQPYNAIGSLRSGSFNYTGLAYPKIDESNFMFIEEVRIPKSSQTLTTNQKVLPSNVYFNFADFEISKVRSPRQ